MKQRENEKSDPSSADSLLRAVAHVSDASGEPPGAAPEVEFSGTPRFVLKRRLGAGGFGTVFQVLDRERGIDLALKALRRHRPSWIYRFKQEFRAVAGLIHPNLIHLYDLIGEEGQWFFTMELIDGCRLLEYLGNRPVEEVRSAFFQLSSGLAALHAAAKVHCDVKPSNVLVAEDGRVVVLDFGLTSDLEAESPEPRERTVAGTPHYMSPEQARGLPPAPASDWYSVGVLLFEALTGRFPAGCPPDQARPSDFAASIPADLDSLCSELLRGDPGERPSGAEIISRLRGATGATPLPPQPETAPFVGRAPELDRLHAAFRGARAGMPRWAMVHGASGIGKTALLDRFLGELRSGHLAPLVLRSRCYEQELVPYKALDGAIDSLARALHDPALAGVLQSPRPRELARLFPVLGDGGPLRPWEGELTAAAGDARELFRRGAAALRSILADICTVWPVVVAIDDLHWGDVDSVELLAEILGAPRPPPLFIVSCHRSGEEATSPFLRRLEERCAHLLKDEFLVKIEVGRLTLAEVESLAANVLPGGGPTLASAIARESGGHPYVALELARSELGDKGPRTLPLDFGRALAARFQRLPEAPRRLLEVVAVAGQPIPIAAAYRAAGLAQDPAALYLVRASHLVRCRSTGSADEVECYHDRIREAVVADLPAPSLGAHHAGLAEALEAAGGCDPERLAFHHDAAGRSDLALPHALRAAEQARARSALDRAERNYRMAHRGAPQADQAVRLQVSEGLGDVLVLLGNYAEARPALEEALQLAGGPLDAARIEGKLGDLAFKRGDVATSEVTLVRALGRLGRRIPRNKVELALRLFGSALLQALHTLLPRLFVGRRDPSRGAADLLACRLLSRLTYAYYFSHGGLPFFWSQTAELNLAELYGETAETADAWVKHSLAMFWVAWLGRAERFADRAAAVFRRLGDLWGEGHGWFFRGLGRLYNARYDGALQALDQAEALLSRAGDQWERHGVHMAQASVFYWQGDLLRAGEMAERTYREGLAAGHAHAMALGVQFWALVAGGDLPAEMIRATEARETIDVQVKAWLAVAEAVRLLRLGDGEAAAGELGAAGRMIASTGIRLDTICLVATMHASALRVAAERAAPERRANLLIAARRAADRAVKLGRRYPNHLAHALRERGLLRARAGAARRARADIDASIGAADRLGQRYERAQSLLARGRAGAAHGWAGAEADLGVAEQALREMGARFALCKPWGVEAAAQTLTARP